MTTNSQVKIGPKPLGAVQENEEDSVEEFLGFLTFTTTGEALVPREWLKERWDQYDIPQYYLPRKPSNWMAYRRMKNELLEDADYSHYRVFNDEYSRYFNCKFDMEKSDEMGSNTYIIYSKVFWPEEIIDEEGGDWISHRVGHMEFYRPNDEDPGQLITDFNEDGDGGMGTVHEDACKELSKRARELFKVMKTHHNYNDLQKIVDNFRDRSNAVQIRRAVYFVGSHHQDDIEGMSKLWKDLNQFKARGEEMRIETTPVINIESQREMIAEKVREKVERLVDNIIGETLSKFEEDDEMTADATSREILNQLSETYNISSEYNTLLSLRMSVKDILEEQREDLKDEQKKIVDSVIDQADLEDFEQ